MKQNEKLYLKLKLIREAEKAIIREYPNNEIKTPSHLAIGAEAIAVGVTEVFPGAAIFASYRNHHWYLASGGNLNNFFLELYGRENPIADGKAGSMHLNSPETGLIMTSAVVATQFGPAIGHAFAQLYKGIKRTTLCVSGDGALEEGAFCESLNIASLYQLPILFVVEDNELAIHQHKKSRQAFDIEKLAEAYGIDYCRQYAYCVHNVIDAAQAITKFPAILHLDYHRFYEHVGTQEDYNAGYREKPEQLDMYDPLYFAGKEISEIEKKVTDSAINVEIKLALATAQNGKVPAKEKLLEHVFA